MLETEKNVVLRLNHFMSEAGHAIRKDKSRIAQSVARALEQDYTKAPMCKPEVTPAHGILETLSVCARGALAKQFVDCARDLRWRQPGFGSLPAEFADKLAVAELIGPDGLFAASDVRVGVLIQREKFEYPMHRHAAEELYYVLEGRAKWAVDASPHDMKAPGSFIYHKSYQPHGILTTETPLCAIWGWLGDISGSTYSL